MFEPKSPGKYVYAGIAWAGMATSQGKNWIEINLGGIQLSWQQKVHTSQ